MTKSSKRKAPHSDGAEESDGKKQKSTKPKEGETSDDTKPETGVHVHPDRVRELRGGEVKPGPVIYWYNAHKFSMRS